jgi:hypothetical protein
MAFRSMKAVKDWNFIHSATLALLDNFDGLTFFKLPLSSRFTFETVEFIASQLQPLRESETVQDFALGLGLTTFDVLRGFVGEFFGAVGWLEGFRNDPAMIFVTLRCDEITRKMLFGFVGGLPLITVFLLMKWLHEKRKIRRKRFVVVSVLDRNVLAVAPMERALIIGTFQNETELGSEILREIEKSIEKQFVL